jgi:hypothetical protein
LSNNPDDLRTDGLMAGALGMTGCGLNDAPSIGAEEGLAGGTGAGDGLANGAGPGSGLVGRLGSKLTWISFYS